MFNIFIPRLHKMQEVIMSLFERLIMPIGTKPTNGWVKWKHSGIPDEEGRNREDARDDAYVNKHCRICTVLSGDYFPAFNMPQYPQHPYCDCLLLSISKPTSQAVANCPLGKFTDYIFKSDNSNGKTHLFEGWGYAIEDSEYLKSEYEKQAKEKYLKGDYSLQVLNNYGQRVTISIELKTANKNVKIKTGWMVHPLGLITCATPYSGEVK